MSIGECANNCNFVHKYLGLMTDAPHMCFELTLELLTAIPVYIWGKRRALRRLKREHLVIDKEHGVPHKEEDTWTTKSTST